MTPLIMAAGLAGIGYVVYKNQTGKPAFQSVNSVGPNGAPIKITTPVPQQVTFAQSTGIPNITPTIGPYYPVPITIPGHGIFYAPPRSVNYTRRDGILQHPPIIITNSGAASIAVGSVRNVQHALNTLAVSKPPLVEDDKLGPKTIGAIKAFQSKNRLVVDGNVSAATKASLSAALTHMAGGSSIVGPIVQNAKPETGSITSPTGVTIDVQHALALAPIGIQHILNVLGASPSLKEDGKIGPKTVAAIKSFQTAHGIIPDGIAGPKTKSVLYLASTPSPALPPSPVTMVMPEMRVTV